MSDRNDLGDIPSFLRRGENYQIERSREGNLGSGEFLPGAPTIEGEFEEIKELPPVYTNEQFSEAMLECAKAIQEAGDAVRRLAEVTANISNQAKGKE